MSPGTHEYLVLDASAAIVLIASGSLLIPGATSGERLVIETRTKSEVRYLKSNDGRLVPIDWENTELAQAIEEVSMSDDEASSFISLSARMHDGEAAAAAVAMNRSIPIVIDDTKARRELAGKLELRWSLEVVHSWCRRLKTTPDEERAILMEIQTRARYIPSLAHPLREWWDERLRSEL